VFRMFDEFIRDAPEQFGGFPGFQIAPPLPFIPENRHGDTLCLVVVHYAGPLDQAEKVLKRFRDVARGPWRTVEQLEYALFEYIDWWNHRRLHGEIGMRTPAEAETAYDAETASLTEAGTP
jgi:transposase InsO family protein